MPPDLPQPEMLRLGEAVERSGLNQTEVAGIVGMDRHAVSRLLSGRHRPSFATVKRILQAIGAKWADLDERE